MWLSVVMIWEGEIGVRRQMGQEEITWPNMSGTSLLFVKPGYESDFRYTAEKTEEARACPAMLCG